MDGGRERRKRGEGGREGGGRGREEGRESKATYVVPLSLQLRWLDRCMAVHKRPEAQNLFGIVQGGLEPELRRMCVKGQRTYCMPSP